MGVIRGEIERAVEVLGVKSTLVAEGEVAELRSRVADLYGDGHWAWPFWERIRCDVSVQVPEGWRLLGDFIGRQPVVLFFEEEDEKVAFLFESGDDLVAVLGECFYFEFYLTDSSLSYLLSCNHHGYLIGAGGASEWVAGLRVE